MNKRILVDMSCTLIHNGHIRLLKKCKDLEGKVIVALTTDNEIQKSKGYTPELNFEQRAEVLQAIEYVDEIVPSPWLIDDEFLNKHNISHLVHGNDNSNLIAEEKLIIFERTQGISSTILRQNAMVNLLNTTNKKAMFTPGPGCVIPQSYLSIAPFFGRGDVGFDEIQNQVMQGIKKLTGKNELARFQGSATLGLEVALANFVSDKVLVINTGYYSERLVSLCKFLKDKNQISKLEVITYDNYIDPNFKLEQEYNWVVSVYVETSLGFKLDMTQLSSFSKSKNAKLYIDATASIGLEDDHHLADLMAFSSVKGLFGMTGAAFVAYNKDELTPIPQQSFYMDINTHLDHKTTGPYHALASLQYNLENIESIKNKVQKSKEVFMHKYKSYLLTPVENEALLCTYVSVEFNYLNGSIGYIPRSIERGSVVCHLGEAHKNEENIGSIYDFLEIK